MAALRLDLPKPTRFASLLGANPVPRSRSLQVASTRLGAKRNAEKSARKPEICTADELHYVDVSNSEWKLALWRYLPSPKAQKRNHPLLVLPGVATNAIGYDLSPESSFARFMSSQGFDTWILELRGIGLSALGIDSKSNNPQSKLLETFLRLSERFSSYLDEGQCSAVASLSRDVSRNLVNIVKESQQSFKPPSLDLNEHLSTQLEDFLEHLDLILKSDWDFDHYLEEDMPAAIEYIRSRCKPQDGKLLAIGHSMGGILLYAMLSRCFFLGKNPGLTSIATLGSSLDYTSSMSSLKLLLPVADPAKALNVPVIPVGVLAAVIHPLACRPPYVLSWFNHQISAPGMVHPELLDKLLLNNFCTVPAKLLLQLTTAFQEGGLQNRDGTFSYKKHLGKSNVPVLAVAGNRDLICPPEAVHGKTVKVIPNHLVSYKVFGKPGGPHYAHYDIVGGRQAVDEVYPCIINFLHCHDIWSHCSQ